MENYYPLPKFLTIKKSKIHGLGLFAKENIVGHLSLGYSHLFAPTEIADKFHCELVRLPLGGFINHSDTPNCRILKTPHGHILWTSKLISKNKELTLDYCKSECGEGYVKNLKCEKKDG